MTTVTPLKKDTSTGLTAQMEAGDVVAPAFLGTGTPSAATVLNGANAWVQAPLTLPQAWVLV